MINRPFDSVNRIGHIIYQFIVLFFRSPMSIASYYINMTDYVEWVESGIGDGQ